MEMHLNPAGGAGHILPMVFSTPSLNETHADGAHLSELIDHLEAMVHGLGEELSKQLVVKDLEAAATGDLTHSCGVEAMLEVAVTALDKDTAVTQTLCVHLATYIIQV